MLFCTTTTAFLPPFLSSVYVFCMVRPGSKVPSCACKACTITLMWFSQICLHCLHRYYMGGKRFQCLCFLAVHQWAVLIHIISLLLAISHFHWCYSSYCQEVCCPCICPRLCQGIHLYLSHHVNNSANGGSSQDDGYSGCKTGKVWDDQGYLILIIAPNSIHLNPD